MTGAITGASGSMTQQVSALASDTSEGNATKWPLSELLEWSLHRE